VRRGDRALARERDERAALEQCGTRKIVAIYSVRV
jgi:hypothetical protein